MTEYLACNIGILSNISRKLKIRGLSALTLSAPIPENGQTHSNHTI